MDERDRERIIERYSRRLAEHGVDIKALASGDPERRLVRFGVLASVGRLGGATVLDVGCGFGDFYAYLEEQGMRVAYTGFDINPAFIDVCRTLHPHAEFEVADIQELDLEDAYDFVVSSQTFNNRLEHDDNEEIVKDVIERSLRACTARGGVAIDMLTSYVDFREPHLHYYSPEAMFEFCKTLTKRVALRHDYPLFEFALFLYKDFAGWAGEAEGGAR